MRLEDIRTLTRAQPFQPFRIHITNGDWCDITHPDMLVSTPGSVCVAVPDPNHPLSDGGGSFRIHSLYHLHTVEMLPPPPKSGSNGPAPKPATES